MVRMTDGKEISAKQGESERQWLWHTLLNSAKPQPIRVGHLRHPAPLELRGGTPIRPRTDVDSVLAYPRRARDPRGRRSTSRGQRLPAIARRPVPLAGLGSARCTETRRTDDQRHAWRVLLVRQRRVVPAPTRATRQTQLDATPESHRRDHGQRRARPHPTSNAGRDRPKRKPCTPRSQSPD